MQSHPVTIIGANLDEFQKSAVADTALHIVVAEDDVEMRRLVAHVLMKDGYDVEQVPDGSALLTRVASSLLEWPRMQPIDLIVTDVRMPHFSGLDVLKALRLARRGIAVLVMTAFGDRRVRTEVQNLGGVLLDKPFTPRSLRALVRDMITPDVDSS